MNTPNPELQLVEEFVQHTNSNIFLTGKAGTGKTTFLHNIKKQTHKRLVVTAPTGVAAINAGGVTLHSFFQMPFGPFVPGSQSSRGQHRFSKEKKNIIKSLDLLVIDEISMVRADMLDCVDSVLRRHRRNNKPFGGVQLLMIGDLHQLSPVVKDGEWRLLEQHYDSPFFFSSTALRQTELLPIELKHIYRQSDDKFIKLLNRVRDNKLDPATLKQLNGRYITDFSAEQNQGYITLCTHNRSADTINHSKLQKLQVKSYIFDAEINGDFPDHTFPTASSLELKAGAQVMFVKNDPSAEKRFFNGKIGKITDISNQNIRVSCPEDQEVIEVEKAWWDNIEYSVSEETAEISEKIVGTFSQYPLKLAWAITIHKSQGLTFDKAIIDAEAAFAHGQVYVALSRCRTFEGIVLSSPLLSSAVKTDTTVNKYVEDASSSQPSREKLETSKIHYQQQLLLECFSFERIRSLLGRLFWLIKKNEEVIHFTGAGDVGEIQRKAGEEIYTIGENFKRQLEGFFSETIEPAADPVVLERLAKASVYFQDKIDTILSSGVEEIQVETDNKEVRKKINATIKLLLEEIPQKFAAVKSCENGFTPSGYLRAISIAGMSVTTSKKKPKTAMYSEADVGHPELFQKLKEWRSSKAADEGVAHFQVLHQKTLIQIAVYLPDTLSDLLKIKGIGKKLAERYGEELVELVIDYRLQNKIEEVTLPDLPQEELASRKKEKKVPKEDTRQITRELFESGMTIEQIAEKREFVRTTIEGHLAFLVEKGEVDVARLLSDERRLAIEEKISRMRQKSLKEIRGEVGEEYSYGEIQFILGHLKHCDKE